MARRTTAIGGVIKGAPSAKFFDHPRTISLSERYIRTLMNCGACTNMMSFPARTNACAKATSSAT